MTGAIARGQGWGAGGFARVVLPAGPPLLQVVVDTEEEFDWGAPFDRTRVGVTAMQHQHLAQALFAPYRLKPTYVIDHPVATTPDSVAVLAGFLAAGQCQIGAHLHPWVNPPFDEPVSRFNSYAGNLAPALERQKLAALTEAIAVSFGARPSIYKAGRYGVGPATAATLRALGYEIDLSMVPHSDFGDDGGPDFRGCPDRPCWIGQAGGLLAIPLSRGFSGALAGIGPSLSPAVESPLGRRARAGSVLARLGLLERATLTPEGVGFAAQRRLVRAMLAQGHRVFSLTYHSPSLAIGHTPYVRSAADLAALLERIRRLLQFFFDELGGQPTTALEIRRMALAKLNGSV